jgi:cell shape-determining protein MreC
MFRDSLQPMDAAALAHENALLKARLAEVEAALAEVQEANRRLEDILRTSQREQFGKKLREAVARPVQPAPGRR